MMMVVVVVMAKLQLLLLMLVSQLHKSLLRHSVDGRQTPSANVNRRAVMQLIQ